MREERFRVTVEYWGPSMEYPDRNSWTRLYEQRVSAVSISDISRLVNETELTHAQGVQIQEELMEEKE